MAYLTTNTIFGDGSFFCLHSPDSGADDGDFDEDESATDGADPSDPNGFEEYDEVDGTDRKILLFNSSILKPFGTYGGGGGFDLWHPPGSVLDLITPDMASSIYKDEREKKHMTHFWLLT